MQRKNHGRGGTLLLRMSNGKNVNTRSALSLPQDPNTSILPNNFMYCQGDPLFRLFNSSPDSILIKVNHGRCHGRCEGHHQPDY